MVCVILATSRDIFFIKICQPGKKLNYPNKYTVVEGDAPVKKTAQNVNETQAEADFLAYPEG